MSTLLANLTSTLGISAERRAIRSYLRSTPPPVAPANTRITITVPNRIGFETWDVQIGHQTAA